MTLRDLPEQCAGRVRQLVLCSGRCLDEDEMARYLSCSTAACPFFEPGDEYKIVQKQN